MEKKKETAEEAKRPESAAAAALPIGSVVMWTNEDMPSGWLLCDGSIYAQRLYPELFAQVGHSFGACPKSHDYDPAKQFFVPDLRGRFVRGVDSGAGRDPDAGERRDMQCDHDVGDQVGSVQKDEFAWHTHSYSRFPGVRGEIASGTYWAQTGGTTGGTGGRETRPKNAYLYFIIKAQ